MLFASALFLVMLASCNKSQNVQQQNPANTPVPVNAYTVADEEVVGIDTYPGTVVPLNEVELRAQVTGYITNIYVQDGQKVSKGQKLYEIDRTKYQAAYNQAQANLQSARANLERVQKDAERYENLSKQDAIARQRVDYVLADLKTAQSQVAAGEAALASTGNDLKYAVITAPFSGTIGISQVKIGTQVSPGQTLLNTVSSDDPIAVDFVISQSEIPRFNRIQAQKSSNDSLFTIQFGDRSVYQFPGKLTAIDRAVDRQTGTITVRLSFPNPSRQLIAGMSVVVRALNEDIGRQIVIPYKAVTEQMGEFYAYVIQADSVQQRRLALGSAMQDKVVVREGLKAGESIVVEGTQKLRQGAKVQLGNTQPAPQAQAAGR